jgi:hypothetical protein
MGEVYKASNTRIDRIVALKISKTKFSERSRARGSSRALSQMA